MKKLLLFTVPLLVVAGCSSEPTPSPQESADTSSQVQAPSPAVDHTSAPTGSPNESEAITSPPADLYLKAVEGISFKTDTYSIELPEGMFVDENPTLPEGYYSFTDSEKNLAGAVVVLVIEKPVQGTFETFVEGQAGQGMAGRAGDLEEVEVPGVEDALEFHPTEELTQGVQRYYFLHQEGTMWEVIVNAPTEEVWNELSLADVVFSFEAL